MSKDLDRVIEYAEKTMNFHRLFDHLLNEHSLLLIESEKREIILHVIEDLKQLFEEIKSEQPKPKDGNECIGMEVRYVGETTPWFTKSKWYKCVGNYNDEGAFIDNEGYIHGSYPHNNKHFDIDNPRPIKDK